MLNKIKELSKKTKVILLAVCLIVIAGVGSVITACTMVKSDTDTSDDKVVATESATEPTEQATVATTELPTEEKTEEPTEVATEQTTEEETEQPTEKKDKENEKEEATIVQTTTTIVGDNQNNSSNNNANNSTTNNTNTGTATQSKPVNNDKPNNTTTTTPSKVWHEAEYKTVHHPAETKKVWVVDQEGYTYEEPIYEEHDRTICNDCGADITDFSVLKPHLIAEVKNGGTGSYRNEWREVQVGTKTITVEEKGHWETQVVKEAWDEQVLIKEAGYY